MPTMSDGNTIEKTKLPMPRLPPPPPSGLPTPPNSKTADGRERLQHIVNVAIEVATRHNHPDQVRAIREMYELSKKDTTISELMDKVLARKATPEQYAQFQKLMRNLQTEMKAPSMAPQTPVGSAPHQQQNSSYTTVGGNTLVAEGTPGGAAQLSSESSKVQDMGETTSLMEPERQPIAEPKTGSDTIDQIDIENTPSNSQDMGRTLGHPSDAMSDFRAPKRLKRVRREGEIESAQGGGRNGEEREGRNGNIAEEGGNEGGRGAKRVEGVIRTFPPKKSIFSEVINSDKEFVSKVVKGCLERSLKNGHADIGRAIQSFYEKSLVESQLEGFFEELITGRIDKEPVVNFQKFIGEYIRNTQKSKLKGTKPVAKSTVPTQEVKEVESTGNQDRRKRGQTQDLEIITIHASPSDELTKISEVSSNVQKIQAPMSGEKPVVDSTSTSDANTLLSTMINPSPPVPEQS
ncbi:uncharacterized protein LAJ45_05325 [Morchella importuna]|uniref:uncharacterized protein n=1 Tax=Morchella importuna TaxID=1174673 RepID=UPI001E8E2CE9|nr:uncharacterized protein LAJ45_05325 [Morchella importuna]KAH8150629.1 hypothetical protein LAJ45_05325 [Morchella importuna]